MRIVADAETLGRGLDHRDLCLFAINYGWRFCLAYHMTGIVVVASLRRISDENIGILHVMAYALL